jgi:uncharacterized delta-60 repeat protein
MVGMGGGAVDLAIQPDGKIVAGGGAQSGDFGLLRVDSRGRPDPSFGQGGRVHTDFGMGAYETAAAIELQTDGKIVAAGAVNDDFGLARYQPDGRLDRSFGSNGLVIVEHLEDIETVSDLALQTDGKIVISGSRYVQAEFQNRLGTARFLPDGTLDQSFGSGGIAVTAIEDQAVGRAVAVQSDGQIVVAGFAYKDSYQEYKPADVIVVRYNSDGSLDQAFGRSGIVRVDYLGQSETAEDVAIQEDGRIVVAGHANPGLETCDVLLARFLANGTRDRSLGSRGYVLTDIIDCDEGYGLTIQPDNKLVVVGISEEPDPSYEFDAAIIRYMADGSLDRSFGVRGVVVTSFGAHDAALEVQVQQDGKIVVAGSNNLGNLPFILARYLG